MFSLVGSFGGPFGGLILGSVGGPIWWNALVGSFWDPLVGTFWDHLVGSFGGVFGLGSLAGVPWRGALVGCLGGVPQSGRELFWIALCFSWVVLGAS